MAKVSVQIGFYLQGQHYAQMQAFLPRVQALKIPQLKITQRLQKQKPSISKPGKKPGKQSKNQSNKSQKSQSKRGQSDEEINEEDQNININELQNEPDNQQDDVIVEDQQLIEEQRVDSQKEQQNLMKYLQEQEDSDDDDLDEDISSISRLSGMRNNHKTKRQKGERSGLMELPDRRPRKDKKFDQATELIRRQEKQRKRKQYLKKQIEAQQKATLDKILNQTGRKLKLREEKQNQDEKKRDQKTSKNLGDVPKIITIHNQQSSLIMLHQTSLFNEYMTRAPSVKIKQQCSNCGKEQGRYKIKNTNKIACGLNCYKLLV